MRAGMNTLGEQERSGAAVHRLRRLDEPGGIEQGTRPAGDEA